MPPQSADRYGAAPRAARAPGPDAPAAPIAPRQAPPGPDWGGTARPGRPSPANGVPTATCRLLLGPEFPFPAASAAVPRLASLGFSHLHLTPLLEAATGRGRQPDTTDHRMISAVLGGEAGLRQLAATAHHHGMGLVADFVPGHMAVPAPLSPGDPLWDVLLHGPASRYAAWFDIDWDAGGGQLLMPVLDGPIGNEWQACTVADGMLRYGGLRFPLRPGTGRMPLPELLDHQHYRLAWWRLARTELNYRRSVTSSTRIALRPEHGKVFDATHETLLRLLDEGVLSGLQVRHADQLADPAGYLQRLADRTSGVWTIAEKVLSPGEQLPGGWPVAGTTGYDALRHIDAVLTDGEGSAALTETYRAHTGAPPDLGGDWDATARRAAHRVLNHDLAAEVSRLLRSAEAACRAIPGHLLRDHAPWALRLAITELLAALPVYRPHVPAGGLPGPVDEAMLASAADTAHAAFTVPHEAQVVHTVRELALGRLGGGADASDFRVRFAVTSAALHDKATEEIAAHRYIPLPSAGEPGGDPGEPALLPGSFHTFCGRIQRDWPATATALTSHRTKHTAQARAVWRALTERPGDWSVLLPQLAEEAARSGARAPDPHVSWAAWTTALGLGTRDPEPLLAAALRSARAAALHTTRTEPDAAYEEALEQFVRRGPGGPAGALIHRFRGELDVPVRAQVLAAVLLQLTMPGVPDVCYPVECLDPDARLGDAGGAPSVSGPASERHRLTAVALGLRRACPDWFGPRGGYRALSATGEAAEHCLAFTRAERVVTAVTRLSERLARTGGWRETMLRLPDPDAIWADQLSGRRWSGSVPLAALFAEAPVALLVRTPAE